MLIFPNIDRVAQKVIQKIRRSSQTYRLRLRLGFRIKIEKLFAIKGQFDC